MTQKFSLFEDLTVRENLEFLAAVQDIPTREGDARASTNCSSSYHFADRQKQLAGTMSGGQKQRLALAGAVIHKPELLFLDEPTSAVDPESRRDFWEKLFELADAGTTILVSTHYMDEAERCHRLAILDRGVLVADGTPGRTHRRARRPHARGARRRSRAARSSALMAVPGVLSVAQIGNTLRVLHRRQRRCRDRAATGAGAMPGLQAEVDARPNRTWKTCSSPPRAAATRSRGARRMNWRRLFAIVVKELRQMRRDRITLAMIVGIPVMQLVLFGYAINLNLRGLRTGDRRPGRTPPARARW